MSEESVLALVIILLLIGAYVSYRIIVNIRFKNRSRKTVQKDNVVGGDQAGGDIRKGS